ncbi:hypothetical protein LuPra_03143 [Luteitalea pratensis]|uniref:Uncharacterized protein n=1 Tax=Luteitalea pratensis TaxID=1855912 RepID=A0A143PNB2_LUTPR|nr:hypothetical protein [Luteitalea pratensis]AMY09916.1 hypothetical protein LuPra_03143 [Luteitalea pratensis]
MWTALLMTAVLQAAPGATCRSVGLDPPRTWHFHRTGETWEVTHWRGTATKDSTRVALPSSASVQLTSEAVRVKARTSNGGIDVDLTGTAAQARLDIYVSYELEVNVDASLTPAIDDLNSDGPIGVRCEIASQP